MPKQKAKPTPAEVDAALVRAVCRHHGWSQRTLAALLGVHEVTLSRWATSGGLSPWMRELVAKLGEARPQAMPKSPIEGIAQLLASAYALDRPRPPAPPPPAPRRALPAPKPADAAPEPTRFSLLEPD